MLDALQYRTLKLLYPRGPDFGSIETYIAQGKAKTVFGDAFLREIQNKTVLDFGCGEGAECIEMAKAGADPVIGLDYREEVLAIGRAAAVQNGVAEVCRFVTRSDLQADYIVSIDAFEHFDDPASVLEAMNGLLKPRGQIVVSFGPTWYHPLGGHALSLFPWMHLVFSETALIRWRQDFRPDGATCFRNIGGGLNQMTIRQFERLVARSPFRFASFQAVPIRKLRHLHNPWTREFTSAVVRCRLVRRSEP